LHIVEEANCRFYVNFQDYLDTGLFLDHRSTREMIQHMARGKTFLNLFCYTGTASVHAAIGGASSTTSVDMSTTYLNWCQQNFQLNNIPLTWHRFIKANCMEWIKTEKRRYDLIFVDPPTFSNSKNMEGVFDIQQHHVELLQDCIRLLSSEGQIIFSTNFRKFSFDREEFPQMDVEDISQRTIPQDFSRNRKIHQCWLLKKTGVS
jgi:23S rRNA (guanine2445-N2)-methyltransferase / 23S rRNA (guanine2069-N7)-methyltransferase